MKFEISIKIRLFCVVMASMSALLGLPSISLALEWRSDLHSDNPEYVTVIIKTELPIKNVTVRIDFFDNQEQKLGSQDFRFTNDELVLLHPGVHRRFFHHTYGAARLARGDVLEGDPITGILPRTNGPVGHAAPRGERWSVPAGGNDLNMTDVQTHDALPPLAMVHDRHSCVVRLISPTNNDLLSQRRIMGGKVETVWRFSWSECPSASRYHLYVIGPGALNPIIDNNTLTATSYSERATHYGITALNGWTWRVRAYVDGRWKEWSETGTFNVSPVLAQ